MMISHSPEQAAIATLLAEELAAYDRKLGELLHGGWDPAVYRSLSDQFDRMQMMAQALPLLSSSWTELLISRVDLTHALWSLSTPTRFNGRVRAYHAQHTELVEEVRRKCLRYLAPPAAPRT
jgi:hypothetical protein